MRHRLYILTVTKRMVASRSIALKAIVDILAKEVR